MVEVVGFRIRTDFERPPRDLVQHFHQVSCAAITDAMNKFGAMDPQIRPMVHGKKMVGPALTVRTRAGDNLMCHKANDLAKPGDVVVIDAAGYTRNSIWGELMTLVAKQKGVAGVVIDGAIRDVSLLEEIGLPVYARGVSPMNGGKDGPGEIGFPIQCGNVWIRPGDIVVGDDDGVAVVPVEDARVVLEKARKIEEKWEKRRREIEAGTKLVPGFVNEILKKKGVL